MLPHISEHGARVLAYEHPVDLVPTGPVRASSGLLLAVALYCFIAGSVAFFPFAKTGVLSSEFPSGFLGYVILACFCFQTGFIFGAVYDYDPIAYFPSVWCDIQAVVNNVFGLWSLVMLFVYVYGLHMVIVQKKNGRLYDRKQGAVTLVALVGCMVWIIAVSYMMPGEIELIYLDADDMLRNLTGKIAFGPNGPWCGPFNQWALIVAFYLPCTITSTLTIVCSVQILRVVKHTTSLASGQRANKKRQGKSITKFYVRLCVFAVLYSLVTIAGAIKRVLEVGDTKDITDSNPGILVLLPLLAAIEITVILTTPKVTRFYLSRTVLGHYFGSSSNSQAKGAFSMTNMTSNTKAEMLQSAVMPTVVLSAPCDEEVEPVFSGI